MKIKMRNWLLSGSVALALVTACMGQRRLIRANNVAVSGVSAPISTTPGDSVQSIHWDGLERTYRLHVPTDYHGSKPLPLVFVLHGAGGNGKEMEDLTGFSAKADVERFIVVYPNAAGDSRIWNTGIRPHPFSTADDVGFIRALLNKLEHDLSVDHKRVFCCGFSAGATMTYRLGAEMSERFAAIGVVSGTIGTKQPDGTIYQIQNPARPLPVIHFHGKQDPTVGYYGNGTFKGEQDYVLPVSVSIAFWVNRDGCGTPPHETTEQNGNLIIDDYSQCQGTNEVKLCTFVNGNHEWPTTHNNDDFNATEALWRFFAEHPQA
jgi:polyhydroxybutyrate depolymerase